MLLKLMSKKLKISKLKKNCLSANKYLIKKKLSIQTFGNVSQRIDKNYFIIKPSGINLKTVNFKDFNIIQISTGKVVDSNLNPSSDTETHRILYKNWHDIQGIAHAHPTYGTSWAQAGKPIPVLGTTHADYFSKHVPLTDKMKKKDIQSKYELNTGYEILKTMRKGNLKPTKCPGILVRHHGVFSWGKSGSDAVKNLELIELIALLAFNSLKIGLKDKIDSSLVQKHFNRKHGANFYYGQRK